MKITEMIKGLQEVKEKYGDLECWSAVDDEGNGYNKVYYDPTVMFRLNDEDEIHNLEEFEECKQEHILDYEDGADDEDYEELKCEYMVCVN